MVGGRIEFRPDRDHDPGVEAVDLVDHRLRIGEARGIEGVAAPAVLGPVEPVLDDRVERQAAAAIFADDVEQLRLGLVALAALPEAIGPARHDRRAPGQRAIAGDHPVHVAGADEIIIERVAVFRAQGERAAVGLGPRIVVEQGDIARIGLPLDADVGGAAGGELEVEIVVPGVPVLAPALQHLAAVDEHLRIMGRIEPEAVEAARLRGVTRPVQTTRTPGTVPALLGARVSAGHFGRSSRY